MQFITQPLGEVRLGEFLLNHLTDPQWTTFRAAIAFVKRSGTQHIRHALREFSAKANVRLSAGIDMYGTSKEGLNDLLEATKEGQIFVFRNSGPFTFHPKVYLFKSQGHADVLVGSGNLTGGGLFTNYEASMGASLDLSVKEDSDFLQLVEATLDEWSQPKEGICYSLTPKFLDELVERGIVRSEAQIAQMQRAVISQQQPAAPSDAEETASSGRATAAASALFKSFAVPPPPPLPAQPAATKARPAPPAAEPEDAQETIAAAVTEASSIPTLVISVLTVDLPVQGSSNEVTITKYIRNVQPEFWGWSAKFAGPDSVTGQYRRDIHIRYGDRLVNAYLLDFPGKKPDGTKASADFRLGSIAPIVADLKEEDDLIVLSLSTDPAVDYVARVVRVGQAEHEELMNGMQVYARSKSQNGTYRKFRYIS
jgi:HKD family nuclease